MSKIETKEHSERWMAEHAKEKKVEKICSYMQNNQAVSEIRRVIINKENKSLLTALQAKSDPLQSPPSSLSHRPR